MPKNNPSELNEQKSFQKPTILQSYITGVIASVSEIAINHPLWMIKTRIQCGDPFTMNPFLLYRGVLANAASYVPSTAWQIGFNRVFHKFVFDDNPNLSHPQKAISAFVSGASSAVIRCPVELILTQQRITKKKFPYTARFLIDSRGFGSLWIGFPAMSIRMGGFATSYLVFRPWLKNQLQPYCSNEAMALLLSGIIAGASSALVTQSFDTLATTQQANAHHKSMSVIEAAKKLYHKNRFYAFFEGIPPRLIRGASAATIIGTVNEKVEAWFQNRL